MTLLVWAILTGRVPAPRRLVILYADTRMELLPLYQVIDGALAEQPYLWRVRFRRELIAVEDRPLFERRKRGERQLIDALVAWASLPKADARTLARLIIARGEALYPLTQTETRQALVPFDEHRAGVTRRVLSAWALIEASPAETLPTALRGPAT